jgi:hypothetical protein
MAEPVRAGPFREREASGNQVWLPDILEHLDALAETENLDTGMMPANPRNDGLWIAGNRKDGVAAILPNRANHAKGSSEFAFECGPVIFCHASTQGRLERAGRRLVPIEGEPGAVGTAFAHLRQHPAQQRPKLCRGFNTFEKQPNDSAHWRSLRRSTAHPQAHGTADPRRLPSLWHIMCRRKLRRQLRL